MNISVSEINSTLRGMGCKTTNSQIKKVAARLNYGEAYDYPEDQAQKIIESIMAGRKTKREPQAAYQETSQVLAEVTETALVVRQQGAIARGQQLATEHLQMILASELELTKRAYEANMSRGLALIDQSISQCWPGISLPEVPDHELLDDSIFNSFMHPELALGVAR